MNSSAKKWQSPRNDQRVEIGLVQVDIGGGGDQFDRFADLVLKHAKDILKDTLVRCAECRGGKLSSWEDDGGTFLFPIESPDSFNNCCLAAIEMLELLPAVKREAQLSADLERSMMIRIVCDTGTVARNPEAHNLPGEFVDQLKQHKHVISAENKVTITERIFRQLNNPLKSRFGKWKHSSELGIDLYAAVDAPVKLAFSASSEEANPAEDDVRSQDGTGSSPGKDGSSHQKRFTLTSQLLQSRKALFTVGAAVLAFVLLGGLFRYLARPTTPPPAPQTAPMLELVQSEDWRNWRQQIHKKLTAGTVNESTLVEALKIKPPARPEEAPAALRRDQAIADVLMTYPEVRRILNRRFGIREDGFLGTGLSKPVKARDYGAASVHEYLLPNHPDYHPAVWMRILDPNKNPKDMGMTVQELLENDPDPDPRRKALVEGIVQRVKEKDMASPAVIRFAVLDLSKYTYSHKLGREDAYRVFASNLAELWNTRVKDAADRSGYTFTKGDSLYVWAFLPISSDEVVPATWDEVLKHLPEWLSEMDKK